jgi:hypothetical protein
VAEPRQSHLKPHAAVKVLDLKCDRCGRELNQPGALLFSPPQGESWLVAKHHLCADCYAVIAAKLERGEEKQSNPGDRFS